MSLATAPPYRLDLTLRTNDDATVGALWRAGDGVTPVPISAARAVLMFDVEDIGDPPPDPLPTPTLYVLDADETGFAEGRAVVTIPASIWPDIDGRAGIWDLVATSTAPIVHRCLLRGAFVVEDGVTTEEATP